MTPGRVRVGVVGTGALGYHHARLFRAVDGAELVGIFDINPARAAQVSRELGTVAFPALGALLDVVDAVSVAVPTPAHAAVGLEILSRRRHALIEKPLADSVEGAEALVRKAAAAGVVLQVGHVERFNRAVRAAAPYLDEPRFLQTERLAPFQPRGTDVAVILDLMIHDLDLVHRLVPAALVEVEASGQRVKSRFSDEVEAELGFDDGTQVRLSASRVSSIRRRGMRAVYADGVIEIDFIARTVRNTTRRHLNPLMLQDPLGESVTAFVNAACGEGQAFVRPEEARRALATALEIEKATVPMALPRATGTYARA